jgi:hypothetical protein
MEISLVEIEDKPDSIDDAMMSVRNEQLRKKLYVEDTISLWYNQRVWR